jgi:hypothetical protein
MEVWIWIRKLNVGLHVRVGGSAPKCGAVNTVSASSANCDVRGSRLPASEVTTNRDNSTESFATTNYTGRHKDMGTPVGLVATGAAPAPG